MVSTTSQINKFIEFIAVLGDLIILNLVLFLLLFFWEEAFVSLPFSCRVSWMYDLVYRFPMCRLTSILKEYCPFLQIRHIIYRLLDNLLELAQLNVDYMNGV